MDEQKKLCPMKLTIEATPLAAVTGREIDRFCDDDKCTWWVNSLSLCAVTGIAISMADIEARLKWR
jgi:hypothetical protein